jgi:hypothetical protein
MSQAANMEFKKADKTLQDARDLIQKIADATNKRIQANESHPDLDLGVDVETDLDKIPADSRLYKDWIRQRNAAYDFVNVDPKWQRDMREVIERASKFVERLARFVYGVMQSHEGESASNKVKAVKNAFTNDPNLRFAKDLNE